MLRVGITGGIGSGKSIVTRVFANFGIPVFNADAAAKKLMENDASLIAGIIRLFGDNAYNEGKLNRKLIASVVFQDPSRLEALNAMVHPATIADGERWMQQQNSPYALKEAALIFESGTQAQLDIVIGVTAPAHLRIHRVMQRDHTSREEIIKRMDQQIDESIKMRLCDYVIVNDDQRMVVPQVLKVHEALLFRSKQ